MGLSWARFGCSWGLLGGSFGAFAGSRWHPEFSKLFIWAPLSPHLGPRGASNSPKRLPRRPHGEADGPTKPPRLIWRRSWTYFPAILETKSMKKRKQNTSLTPFRSDDRLPSYCRENVRDRICKMAFCTFGCQALLGVRECVYLMSIV